MNSGKALSGEIAAGYLGRLRLLNQQDSIPNVYRLLKRSLDLEGEDVSRIELLARASGLDVTSFVRRHTLLPFHRAVTVVRPEIEHGDPGNPSIIKNSAFKWQRSSAFYCHECAANEVHSRGFAYWKRIDQAPGADWCAVHETALHSCALNLISEELPCTANGEDQSIAGKEGYFASHPIYLRYLRICEGFLNCTAPLSATAASNFLSCRAQEMDIRVGKEGKRANLSDFALELAPAGWLERLFPGIKAKRSGEYFAPLDKVFRHSGLPHAHAVTLALLYESADEALDCWQRVHGKLASEAPSRTYRGGDFWRSQTVFRAYIEERGVHMRLARRLGADLGTLRHGLEAAGLPSLGTMDPATDGAALVLFASGQSLSEACAQANADVRKVEGFVRAGGIRFASALKQMFPLDISKQTTSE